MVDLKERKNKEEQDTKVTFYFDSSEDSYEFNLPPECEVSSSNLERVPGMVSNSELLEIVTNSDISEKRVSFDTSRNEYYFVEKSSLVEEADAHDADDENISKVETQEFPSENTEESKSTQTHSYCPIVESILRTEVKTEVENTKIEDEKLVEPDAPLESNKRGVESIAQENSKKYEMDYKTVAEKEPEEVKGISRHIAAFELSQREKLPVSQPSALTMEANNLIKARTALVDDVKANIEEAESTDVIIKTATVSTPEKEPEPQQPISLSNLISKSKDVPEDKAEAAQISILKEKLPSLKNNPFILRDKMKDK